jgi:hypothetical protein
MNPKHLTFNTVAFFAAAKKVSAAPHRGIANRPIRQQGKANTPVKPKNQGAAGKKSPAKSDEKKQKAHRQKPDALQATTKRKTVKTSPAKGPKAGSFNEP